MSTTQTTQTVHTVRPFRALRHFLWVTRVMLSASIKTHMEYRLNFALFVINASLTNLLSLGFLWVVVSRFHNLQGWSLEALFFLFSLRLLGHGVFMVFFFSLRQIPYFVRRGDFDRMLLRPINPLFQIVTWRYNPASIGDLATGLACFVLSSRLLHLTWTPLSLCFLLLVVIGGALIEAGLFLTVLSTTFWLTDVQFANGFLLAFNDYFAIYPLTLFNTALQVTLTFIVPVAFISYYPATAFLRRTGEIPFTQVFAYSTPLVGMLLFVVGYGVWSIGLRHYQSTGS